MKKNKNKGFVLVETLIVTVFVAAIFSIIFLNFYPLIGEYERRENYDDVDSKYAAYWVKKMIKDSDWKSDIYKYSFINSTLNNPPCKSVVFNTDSNGLDLLPFNIVNKDKYISIFKQLGISKVIFTKYDINSTNNLKSVVDSCNISQDFKDYINYLPNFTAGSLTGAKYRVLVEFKHERPYVRDSLKEEDITEYPYYTYATLEVMKE